MSILSQYFDIIRLALKEERRKGTGVYYEAHHIIPQSFKKKSSVVLLTPEEHYKCHKILAEFFCKHQNYGKKMLWAFHRMTYSRKLTEQEYSEARKALMPLWTRKQTLEHRQKISKAQLGNTNNKSRVFKGMKSDMTEEGKQKLAETRKRELTGKIGLEAKASKGTVICEYEDGRKVEAGSALQLSYQTGIPASTISCRLSSSPNQMKKGYKLYYK